MSSHRVEKMASNVRSIISDVIHNGLNDPRISPMASVTRVEVTRDLQLAKVFISVLGTEPQCRRTMVGLQHASGHIQRVLARRLQVRVCPHITLHVDDSLKKTAEILELIRVAMAELPAPATEEGEPDRPDDESDGVEE